MTLRLVFNPADSPLVADSAGHMIGGSDWGTVESLDPVSSDALSTGLLQEVDEPDDVAALDQRPDVNRAFKDAVKRHKDRKDKTEKAKKLDKDQLMELADVHLGEDEKPPHKDELVELVATSDVQIPDPPKSSGRGRSSKES